ALDGRTAHADGGIAAPGEIINIPTGEAYIAPIEHIAEGSVVINGSFPGADLPADKEVVLTFERGRLKLEACSFPQNGAGAYCKKLISSALAHDPAVHIGELGIGLNPGIQSVAGLTILDEKVCGTAHIAIGANAVFGGQISAPYHVDMVFYPISIALDD